MAATASSFDSGHADMVHDVQLDYYGRRVATASSDRLIKVFNVVGEQLQHAADLVGHQAPVFEVCWGHPKFGSILASCSFDSRVIIWTETHESVWQQAFNSNLHSSSVNSLSFAPHELGLVLAAASSDGSLSIITRQPDGTWSTEKLDNAHPLGATGVSWAPATPPGSLVSATAPSQPDRRFASSGCDHTVKVWRWAEGQGWQMEGPALTQHSDWVRDVAWSPSLGLPASTLASAGQDGRVFIWSETAPGAWSPTLLHDFQVPVFRVSWSVTGYILAVSDSNNNVTLWKEALDHQWQQLVS